MRQRSKVKKRAKRSGRKCSELPRHLNLDLSSLSSLSETRHGSNRLRWIWRALAGEYPDFNLRLARLVRLIDAGECSLLPTPCKSDGKRWPGSENHSRLDNSRGLRLQEELGVRPGPTIVEWMMGFPIGWTDLNVLATPSSPKSPSGSVGE